MGPRQHEDLKQQMPYLKLITKYPAELLGCEHRIGQLKIGLDADFVRLDGPPLHIQSRIKEVWVEGQRVHSLNHT